jgi:TolB protein
MRLSIQSFLFCSILLFSELISINLGFAQKKQADQSSEGIEVTVVSGQTSRTILGVPQATNIGSTPDTRGFSERIMTTLTKSLQLAGYFKLLEKDQYPTSASSEGMAPQLSQWYTAGTDGVIKVGYEIQNSKIKLLLNLYQTTKERKIRVVLGDGVDEMVTLNQSPNEIKAFVFRFVNQVIRFYTGEPGFFGSRIVAVRKQGRKKSIVLVSSDGGDLIPVTRTGQLNLLPSLAKDRVYFTSYRSGGPHFYMSKQGKVTQVSGRKGLNMGGVLSPDGSSVAISLSFSGSSEIYLIHPENGTILRRLTKNRSIDISPTWSPDGRRIAFVSDREGTPQVWVVNADGSNPHPVTFQGSYNQSPDWSPKGDLIVFTSRDEKYVFDLFTVNPNQPKDIRRLTQNQGSNESASFSPDGRHIVFTSSRTGRSNLYIMTNDGFSQHQLTKGGGYASPSWGK